MSKKRDAKSSHCAKHNKGAKQTNCRTGVQIGLFYESDLCRILSALRIAEHHFEAQGFNDDANAFKSLFEGLADVLVRHFPNQAGAVGRVSRQETRKEKAKVCQRAKPNVVAEIRNLPNGKVVVKEPPAPSELNCPDLLPSPEEMEARKVRIQQYPDSAKVCQTKRPTTSKVVEATAKSGEDFTVGSIRVHMNPDGMSGTIILPRKDGDAISLPDGRASQTAIRHLVDVGLKNVKTSTVLTALENAKTSTVLPIGKTTETYGCFGCKFDGCWIEDEPCHSCWNGNHYEISTRFQEEA